VLITGPSGSGKSQLLSAMRNRHAPGVSWIEPASIRFDDRSVIDTLCGRIDPACPDDAIERGLALLSRVGLAEAWTYLRTPAELSDGQRWRLVLAMMFASASQMNGTAIIAMDEFAALLDRVTAMIVARALRKLITADSRLSAVVVTSHDDLSDALRPDAWVECDFGEYRVTHAPRR
jgi:ABC-type ATPase with predicted acetyltransferase domain